MKQNLTDAILFAVLFLLTLAAGFSVGIIWTQSRAAEAGVGHYTVNPTNGITQFQFKK